MAPDWSLDLGIAPEGAFALISSAINRRPKRALGIKTENEYVGVVGDGAFDIWERQQRAIHARGRIRGRRGGSHIEIQFLLPTRTRVLIVIFFALYAVVAGGIALQGPEPSVSAEEFAIAVGGAATLALLFVGSARRQRANLRRFLEGLFSDYLDSSAPPRDR